MAIQITLLILMLTAPAVYGVQHTVGGTNGWTQSVNYDTWAAGETFVVGDTLLFTYTSSHSVDTVSQADYTSCSSTNPISSNSDGSTTIDLPKTGSMYFICPTAGHCLGGMKLQVNVIAANGTSPTTPSPPPSTTTPSGTPSTTPPSTTVSSPPPPPPSGAASIYCNMNNMLFGFAVVLGTMFAFMG
ncbi:uclacyanin-3-like [Alnus glutinosa]|uniref:uclacyanin-3-like n=1 Tax=Alnus glutinosa TaxID=3517 RepID=UPI002D7A0A78|nr:uclacyanin-3-like [Alnus glutinosa]